MGESAEGRVTLDDSAYIRLAAALDQAADNGADVLTGPLLSNLQYAAEALRNNARYRTTLEKIAALPDTIYTLKGDTVCIIDAVLIAREALAQQKE